MFDTSDSPFCGELPEHREELRSATLFNDPPNSATIGQDTYAYPDVQTAQDEVRKTRDQATRCAITTEVIGGVDNTIALVEAPGIEYCDQSVAVLVVGSPVSVATAPTIGIFQGVVRCGRVLTVVSYAYLGREVTDADTVTFFDVLGTATTKLDTLPR